MCHLGFIIGASFCKHSTTFPTFTHTYMHASLNMASIWAGVSGLYYIFVCTDRLAISGIRIFQEGYVNVQYDRAGQGRASQNMDKMRGRVE